MKQKAFFIIFEELSLKQINFFLEGESLTLKCGLIKVLEYPLTKDLWYALF